MTFMSPRTKPRRHRPKTISAQGITGQRGINLIESAVLKMGSRWSPSGPNEVGIDGYIELFDPVSHEALGLTVAVQSKVVTSIGDASATFDYWCDASDLEYWLRGNTPVILVVSNPASTEAYWIWVQDYFKDWSPAGSSRVTFVKSQDRFDADSFRDIAKIAAPAQGLYFAPSRRKEVLWTNLLSLDGLASHIFVGSTECRSPGEVRGQLNTSKIEPWSGWVLWEKKVISFDDLTEAPWSQVCDRGTVESYATSEWSSSPDPQRQRLFVQLLNQSLRAQLALHARYWPDDDCFAFAGRPQKHSYRSLKRTSKLSVVSEFSPKAADGRVFYHQRHLAFRGQFRRLGDNWYLEITPTYRFTSDGYSKDRFHENRLKRIKEIEGNRAVLSSVLFWADFLRPNSGLFVSQEPPLRFGELLSLSIGSGIDDRSWLSYDPRFAESQKLSGQGELMPIPTEDIDQ
jgi:hypothetical protein